MVKHKYSYLSIIW